MCLRLIDFVSLNSRLEREREGERERARAVKTVTWRANPMQQTVIEEPRVRGVEGGGGERALTTFKPSVTFQRAFKTFSALKRGLTCTWRLMT